MNAGTGFRLWSSLRLFVALFAIAFPAPAATGREAVQPIPSAPKGCGGSKAVIDDEIARLHHRDPITRARTAKRIASCGDRVVPELIARLDESLLREEANGAPDDQAERTDRLIWALTNSSGAPEEALLDWIRNISPPDGTRAAVEVAGHRRSIVTSILGARGTLDADRIGALLGAPERDLRTIGVALVPTIAADVNLVRGPLNRLSEQEADPEVRQASRLALINLGGVSPVADWLAAEESREKREVLGKAAARTLPIPFLLERASRSFPVGIREEAAELLATQITLPPDAISTLLDLVDDSSAGPVDIALRRINPSAPEWSRYLDRLISLARNGDSGKRAIGLNQLAILGRRAAPIHPDLRTLYDASMKDGMQPSENLKNALVSTAPGDAAQYAIALSVLERSIALGPDGSDTGWLNALFPEVGLTLAAEVARLSVASEAQKQWRSALSVLVGSLAEDDSGADILQRLVRNTHDASAKSAICSAVLDEAGPTTDLDSFGTAVAELWWTECGEIAPTSSLPSAAQLDKRVRVEIRNGERYDPLDNVIAGGVYDSAPNRIWAESLLMDSRLPRSSGLAARWCLAASREPDGTDRSTELLSRLDWPRAETLLDCPLNDSPRARKALWSRIVTQQTSFLSFSEQDPYGACWLLEFAVDGVSGAASLSHAEVGALLRFLNGRASFFRACTAQLAGSLVPVPGITRALRRLASDRDRQIARPASESLLRQVGDEDTRWPDIATRAVELGLADDLEQFDRDEGIPAFPEPPSYDDEWGEIIVTSSGIPPPKLPPFPWPPPRYAARMTFGVDAPRSLLGSESASLGSVHDRLAAAFRTIDRQYSSGIFGVSGGFVLMTRMEQVDDAGRPLPGRYRWRSYRRPPTTLTDYLVRLFIAPPGHYRTFAFVLTDQTVLTPGKKALPEIDEGSAILPASLAEKRFGGVHVHVLVYAFAKKDTDQSLQVWRDLAASDHLDRAGIYQQLAR